MSTFQFGAPRKMLSLEELKRRYPVIELSPEIALMFANNEPMITKWMSSGVTKGYQQFSCHGIHFTEYHWDNFLERYDYYTSPLYKALT